MIVPKFWLQDPGLLLPNRKPARHPRIDWRSPMAKGLEAWIVFGPGNIAFDLVKHRYIGLGPAASDPQHAIAKGEIARDFGLNTDQRWYLDADVVPVHGQARTVMFRALIENSTNSRYLFGTYNDGGDASTDLFAVQFWSANRLFWTYGTAGTDGRILVEYAAALNRWTNYACVSEGVGGSFKAIYFDAEKQYTLSPENVSDGPALGNAWVQGFPLGCGYITSPSNFMDGYISDFRTYNRVLSQRELLELQNDYWGALLPA